jgi:hypothetical protein
MDMTDDDHDKNHLADPPSLSIQCLSGFSGIRRNYRTCRDSKRCGFDMRFWQKSVFFRFLTSDSISQWRGRFRYPLYY